MRRNDHRWMLGSLAIAAVLLAGCGSSGNAPEPTIPAGSPSVALPSVELSPSAIPSPDAQTKAFCHAFDLLNSQSKTTAAALDQLVALAPVEIADQVKATADFLKAAIASGNNNPSPPPDIKADAIAVGNYVNTHCPTPAPGG
jgi:hypothetical protein